MRKRTIYIIILISLVFLSCRRYDTSVPDSLNRRAYVLRYTDVDSSLKYANRAYELSANYPDGKAEAISHIAFAHYQQMRYTEAQRLLKGIDSLTNNQVELLCADIMRMKITQRTSEFHTFYRAWHNAERRLKRIEEEEHLLSSHLLTRLQYARTEMHIIAATFYFYSHNLPAARAQIKNAEEYLHVPRDTSQWVNYMYMLAVGGILTGDSTSVRIQEFDHLMHIITIAKRSKNKYFHANALQSLSLMVETPQQREWFVNQRGGSMDYLVGQYSTINGVASMDSLPLMLANYSLKLFREYGDNFQTANVLRTKAEILFRQQRYQEALLPLQEALDIIVQHHDIESRNVSYWEARIYERLSLVYSALGDLKSSLDTRKNYLSLWDSMRQDLEEDARAEELQSYNNKLYINLSFIIAVFLVLFAAFWFLLRKVKKHNIKQERVADEALQVLKDETSAKELQLAKRKLINIERRAKVSLAENVVPYINRMLHTHDVEYVAELATEILRINGILTEWIQLKRGQVAMNIGTFPLQPLLDTIAKNKTTYKREGLTLNVPHVDYSVKADRALTLFMINTLCDNARKFTPEGGTINIDVRADESLVEISVEDTGCGLSQEDVDKINNSKVFRIKSTSVHNDDTSHKANRFGFGLMNCKGIINNMKKLSDRFQDCDFGVESTLGKGSRFWFRLPRVMSLIVCFCSALWGHAQEDYASAYENYQMMYTNNFQYKHLEAYQYGQLAVQQVPQDSTFLRMEIANQMAIACQALNMWEDYKKYNTQYLQLYRINTSDPNLSVYAERIHMLETETSWTKYFMVILIICSVVSLVLVVRRSSQRRKEMQEQSDLLIQQQELHDKTQYELDRVHIQNRILANCLSTIKHETMYYPARIQQLAQYNNVDMTDMHQLMAYYNEVYTILLEQAQRQTAFKIVLDESVLQELKRRIMSSISNIPVEVTTTDKGNIQEIRIKSHTDAIPDNLFTLEAGNLDAFVAREIVRMHDAACGFPGLRLYVENNEIIITLWKNSKLLSSKTFSWN